jgi:hypothetical protein
MVKDEEASRNDKKAKFFMANAIALFNKDNERWKIWLERLENTFNIFGIKEEEDKSSLLLHFMGHDTYNTFRNKTLPDKVEDKKYKEIVDTINEIFEPKTLEIVENLVSWSETNGYRNSYGIQHCFKKNGGVVWFW